MTIANRKPQLEVTHLAVIRDLSFVEVDSLIKYLVHSVFENYSIEPDSVTYTEWCDEHSFIFVWSSRICTNVCCEEHESLTIHVYL